MSAAYVMDPPTDLQEVYVRSNLPVTEESDTLLPIVEGAVPDDLRGTLYRNGPGRLEVYGQRYDHPFDGDGHLHRFAFTDRGLAHRNRYVRTREFLEEEAARKILYRSFGTNIPGGLARNFLRMRFKNAANTSVMWHAGRLHALWEAGWPHRIDPLTLDTLARDDLGGMLRPDSLADRVFQPELPFSAHPRRDPASGDLFNFGVATGPRSSLLLYRLAADGTCLQRERMPLHAPGFIHDFTLTSRYRVFFFTPASFDIRGTLLGLTAPAATLRARPEATEILLLPRRGTQPRVLQARGCFVYHFANAFDDGDHVIVDAVRMDRVPAADAIPRMLAGQTPTDYPNPYLTRYILDVRTGRVEERRLTDHPGELPTIDPARSANPHRHVYSVARHPDRKLPFSTGILKVDTDRPASTFRDFGDHLTGEPIFVPRPRATADDDGWLLSMTYDPARHTGELLVLDASDLRTIARARMPHHSPLGFHGTWVPA